MQPNMWTANGASFGLCVETAVGRIFVFGGTLGTERKIRHGGIFAVVGNGFNNGKTRTAVSAVSERVVVAPIGWVE